MANTGTHDTFNDIVGGLDLDVDYNVRPVCHLCELNDADVEITMKGRKAFSCTECASVTFLLRTTYKTGDLGRQIGPKYVFGVAMGQSNARGHNCADHTVHELRHLEAGKEAKACTYCAHVMFGPADLHGEALMEKVMNNVHRLLF